MKEREVKNTATFRWWAEDENMEINLEHIEELDGEADVRITHERLRGMIDGELLHEIDGMSYRGYWKYESMVTKGDDGALEPIAPNGFTKDEITEIAATLESRADDDIWYESESEDEYVEEGWVPYSVRISEAQDAMEKAAKILKRLVEKE